MAISPVPEMPVMSVVRTSLKRENGPCACASFISMLVRPPLHTVASLSLLQFAYRLPYHLHCEACPTLHKPLMHYPPDHHSHPRGITEAHPPIHVTMMPVWGGTPYLTRSRQRSEERRVGKE